MSNALAWSAELKSRGETAELVRQARSGDLEAFELLVRRHERRVLRVAYQMVGNLEDAQDVAQDVYIRLWKYLGRIRDEAKFTTWLYRLVTNVSYDLLSRRKVTYDHVPLDDPEGRLPEIADEAVVQPDHGAAGAELRDRVLGALDRLTPSERTVFVLKDIEDLDVKEIAAIHRSSPITVRRHLSAARHKMRAMLAALEAGPARRTGADDAGGGRS